MSRYSRHIALEGFGPEGQERVRRARVLIVGCGGLGSPCALYLAAAGVSTIGLVDGDTVSLSNLQRQIIHFTDDLDRPKVDSAADKMHRINPEVKVVTYPTMLTAENADEIMAKYDFILDCTDSPAAKYLVTALCEQWGKPYCCGGVTGYCAQIMTHLPGTTTYSALFPQEETTASTFPAGEESLAPNEVYGERVPQSGGKGASVLGPAVGIMGSIQACEAIKYITGIGELLTNRLLTIDVRTMDFQMLIVN